MLKLYMVVSLNKGPSIDPQKIESLFWDPQEGTPHFGKPPMSTPLKWLSLSLRRHHPWVLRQLGVAAARFGGFWWLQDSGLRVQGLGFRG